MSVRVLSAALAAGVWACAACAFGQTTAAPAASTTAQVATAQPPESPPSQSPQPVSPQPVSPQPGSPQPGPFSLSSGIAVWAGDYGAATSTDFEALLLSARYRLGGLRFTASIPVMQIRSAGEVFSGIEGTPLIVAPDAGSTRRERSGVGDLTLGAFYDVAPVAWHNLDLDFSARVKVPTASDSSGLSTGKTDYALGAQLTKSVGAFAPFVGVSYRSFGDTPQYKLRDGVATSVGASYIFSNRFVGQISYDYAQSASRFVSDSDELVASGSVRLNDSGLRLSGYAAAGLSSGAAAVSGGVSLSLSL